MKQLMAKRLHTCAVSSIAYRGGARENSWGGGQAPCCRVRHVNSNDINESCFGLYSVAVNVIPDRCRCKPVARAVFQGWQNCLGGIT